MPVKRNPLHKSLVEEGAKSQLQFLQLIPLHKSLVRGGCQVPIAVPVETLLCCQKRISASQKGNPLHKSLGGCQVLPRIQLQFQWRSSNSCDPMKWTSVQFKKGKAVAQVPWSRSRQGSSKPVSYLNCWTDNWKPDFD